MLVGSSSKLRNRPNICDIRGTMWVRLLYRIDILLQEPEQVEPITTAARTARCGYTQAGRVIADGRWSHRDQRPRGTDCGSFGARPIFARPANLQPEQYAYRRKAAALFDAREHSQSSAQHTGLMEQM